MAQKLLPMLKPYQVRGNTGSTYVKQSKSATLFEPKNQGVHFQYMTFNPFDKNTFRYVIAKLRVARIMKKKHKAQTTRRLLLCDIKKREILVTGLKLKRFNSLLCILRSWNNLLCKSGLENISLKFSNLIG